MIVIYRMTSIPSTNPSPIYQDNKMKLNELCLKSFVMAFEEQEPQVEFICDFCPQEYTEMIERVCPFPKHIQYTNMGINETALLAYDIAHKQDDDILFAECDYIWIPNSGGTLLDGLQELGMVSPYDHLNFYIDKTIHSPHTTIRLIQNHHWRTVERNTMTFAIKNKIFKRLYQVFSYYGYLDNEVWKDCLSKGQPLFTPLPSLATHMVRDWLSPYHDWEKLWKTIQT